jgi:3-oxoacyl-[acyl-carrier-protein] synthase-3
MGGEIVAPEIDSVKPIRGGAGDAPFSRLARAQGRPILIRPLRGPPAHTVRFDDVCIEAFAHVLPDRVVTSAEIEDRLAPLYERLRVSPGRLEMMSGIRERRFFDKGTRPSSIAAAAGERALIRSGIERARIGCLVHAAVCRDFLEPATASVVHHALGLAPECIAFDLSNACLGFANAMAVAGGMIERGEIEAALVVSGEDGGPLVEATLRRLLDDPKAGRAELKRAHASLTIGSAGAACVLARRDVARRERRLVGGAGLVDTARHELCQGDLAEGFGAPLMETDSEALLQAGVALAARTFTAFLDETGWTADSIARVVTHQVGTAHKKLLYEALALDPAKDFPTVATLGNTGSASMPVCYAMAEEAGFVRAGDRVAMLGIGSGLACMMLAVEA